MKLYLTKNNPNAPEPIELGESFAKGGEGKIHSVVGSPDLCAKLYREPKEQTHSKLKAMLSRNGLQFFKEGFCWPQGIILDHAGSFQGYTMPRVVEPAKPLMHLMRVPLQRAFLSLWDRESLCLLALRFLDMIDTLHEDNILIGDINEHNILITPDPSTVYIVDTDSFQIDNFLCPVGQAHYTPPELLGTRFEETPRTESHERFAVAVLLFKIFMLGQAPYASIGGQSPTENIREGNFPYPLSINENQGVPSGRWEAIWRSMDYPIKELFVSVFLKDTDNDPEDRPSLTQWREAIQSYREAILNEKVMGSLWPDNLDAILAGRAVKIDDGRKRGMGQSENILHPSPHPRHIGVLELSTRAVKLLVGDVKTLLRGFKWQAFKNEANLTHTGTLLDENNILHLDEFRDKVFPTIQKMMRLAKKFQVKRLFCVATAAYRSAKNREEILDFLNDELNLSVQILDRREEARATVDAYLWNRQDQFDKGPIVLVDQGGGSTEVSVFTSEGEIVASAPIPIGTTSALNAMFSNAYKETAIDFVLAEGAKAPRRSILRSTRHLLKNFGPFSGMVGVGTAITKASRKHGNRRQHGTVIPKTTLEKILNTSYARIVEEVDSAEALYEEMYKSSAARHENPLLSNVVMHVGTAMYLELLERFELDSVTVNGVGLRYGIFHQKMKEIFPGYTSLVEEWEQTLVTKYQGLSEGTVVDGWVKNITDFGVFVDLGPVDGLIHISQFQKLGKEPEEVLPFRSVTRVFIQKIQIPKEGKKVRVTLELWDDNDTLLL